APGMPETRGSVVRAGSVRAEDDRLRGDISSIVHEAPPPEGPVMCRFGDTAGPGPLARIPRGGIRWRGRAPDGTTWREQRTTGRKDLAHKSALAHAPVRVDKPGPAHK